MNFRKSTDPIRSINATNLVFLLPSFKPGGGLRAIISIANEILNKEDFHEITFVYPNNSNEQNEYVINSKIGKIVVGELASKLSDKIINLFKAINLVNNKFANSIVIVTDPITSLCSPLLRSKGVCRFVQGDEYNLFNDLETIKNKFLLKIYKMLIRFSYHYRVNYFFNSKYTYRCFLKTSKRKDVQFKQVCPGVDCEVFFPKGTRKLNELNICLVARKHPFKGFSDFLNAYKKIKDKINIKNIYAISSDDLSKFDLTSMQVIKPRNDFEISEYFNLSHIFVYNSRSEGFGLPPIEAMACGCAVILSDSGGVNEYALPDVNCLMYTPGNVEELKNKILMLIKNEDLRLTLSHNGLLRAKEFSWRNSALQFLSCLK